MMFNISVIDDAEVEGNETFFVDASTAESQAQFITNPTQVVIVDNNGTLLCMSSLSTVNMQIHIYQLCMRWKANCLTQTPVTL